MIPAASQIFQVCLLLIGLPEGAATTKPIDGHSGAAGAAVNSSGIDGGILAAVSEDGIRFVAREEPAFRTGRHPTMACTAGDELLVVFESCGESAGRRGRHFLVSRSRDDGETWSAPERLDLSVPGIKDAAPRDPALICSPSGELVLLFVCTDRRGGDRLYCSKSKDGKAFGDCARVEQERGRPALVDPVGFYAGHTCHVFGSILDRPGRAYLSVWNEGRRLKPVEGSRVADMGRPGCVIAVKNGFRMYGTSGPDIVSAFSKDGRDWSRERGARLVSAADPAVARLSSGWYLMLYVKGEARSKGRDRRRDRSEGSDREVVLYEVSDDAESAEHPGEGMPRGEVGIETDGAEQVAQAVDPENDGSSVGAELATGEQDMGAVCDSAPDDRIDGLKLEFSNSEDFEPQYTEDGLPIPDFHHPVDYRRILEERYGSIPPGDNASDYYKRLMPYPGDAPGDKPVWPELVNMFSDSSHEGPPGPWDPAEHPAWETATQASGELLGLFSEAAALPNYVTEPLYAADSPNDLLMNIMLPNLSGQRKLVKQALSDAWRAPEGQPDPDTMLATFDTCLSSAEHLTNGLYLIERLVGVADKKLIHQNALWALKREVFTPEQMETAIELLEKKDLPLDDPGDWVQGELMCSMDVTQYLFGPVSPDREPALNRERIAEFNRFYETDGMAFPEPTEEELAHTTAGGTIRGFREYYREYADMVRRGYPEVRPADLDRVQQSFVETNYVAKQIAPSLSRVYTLTTQYEASRRATQLTYAIHLHKARTGKWPASLDELPERHAGAVRTDPFSGEDFAYRLGADGPVLYSKSENGRDDGGVHHRRWGSGSDGPDTSDDFVFWPPQDR